MRTEPVYRAGLPQPSFALLEQSGCRSLTIRRWRQCPELLVHYAPKARPGELPSPSRDIPSCDLQGTHIEQLHGFAVCRPHTLCFAFTSISADPDTMKHCISLWLHWASHGKSRDSEHLRVLQLLLHTKSSRSRAKRLPKQAYIVDWPQINTS